LISAATAYRNIALLEIYGAFPRILENNLDPNIMNPAPWEWEFEPPDEDASYLSRTHSWLRAIAVHTLEDTSQITITSAASRLLPLILVSAAGQLRFPSSLTALEESQSAQQDGTIEARCEVEQRMLALSRKYPQRHVLQMLDIAKEVWLRLDDGDSEANWIDVSHDKGWQTLFG
jgi:hypothetical protein